MTRIFLRALEPEDYKLISLWHNDDDITKTLCGNHFFVSEARDKLWTEKRSTDESKGIYLAVCLTSSREMIGYVSMVNIDLRNLKLDIGGWLIGEKKLWNQGYSKEAVEILLRYAFNEFPINKCSSYCLEEHTISVKTHLSMGFNRDGVLREDVYKSGVFKNIIIFSMLRSEYQIKYATF